MSESETGMVLLGELDVLSNWDYVATTENSKALCERSGVIVARAEQSEDHTFLIRAWACWSFFETMLPGGKKKWQLTRIVNPQTGELPPFAESRKEFCLNHLRMAPSTASGYKSIWDTYVVKMGIDRTRLSLAGKSKLLVAQKLVKDMYPGRNDALMYALFDPETSLAELTALVEKLRKEREDSEKDDEDDDKKGEFEGDFRYESESETLHWTGWFIYNGARYPLRELVFDVLDEESVGQGVPGSILGPFREALEKILA